jgi:hypothetical protein
MAHPGRLFAELGFPVTPVLPHILARAVNASDFRPSRFLFESPRSLPIGIIGLAAEAHFLAIATSLMAGANSRYERASSALLARSYVHSAQVC